MPRLAGGPEYLVFQARDARLLFFYLISIDPHQLQRLQLGLHYAVQPAIRIFLALEQCFDGIDGSILALSLPLYFDQHDVLPLLDLRVARFRDFEDVDNIPNLLADIIKLDIQPRNSLTLLRNGFPLLGNHFAQPLELRDYLYKLSGLMVLLAGEVHQKAL